VAFDPRGKVFRFTMPNSGAPPLKAAVAMVVLIHGQAIFRIDKVASLFAHDESTGAELNKVFGGVAIKIVRFAHTIPNTFTTKVFEPHPWVRFSYLLGARMYNALLGHGAPLKKNYPCKAEKKRAEPSMSQ
jgi:hypothetical protein